MRKYRNSGKGGLHINEAYGTVKATDDFEDNGWVKLIDPTMLCVDDAIRFKLYSDIASGLVPIVVSPSLSDDTVKGNQCASVLETKIDMNTRCLWGLLKAEGKKAHIFKQMLEDGYPVFTRLSGKGEVIYDNKVAKLSLKEIKYISVNFVY